MPIRHHLDGSQEGVGSAGGSHEGIGWLLKNTTKRYLALSFAFSAWLCLLILALAVNSRVLESDSVAQVIGPTAHIEVPVSDKTFHPDPNARTTFSLGPKKLVFSGNSPVVLHLQDTTNEVAIALPEVLSQVDDVRPYKENTAVIAGSVNGDVSMVVVIDLSKKQVLDSFLCYSPTISPNGRFVSFVKFYPAHGIPSAESHYMLYDAAKTAYDNRPHTHGRKLDPACVGDPVFPAGVGNAAGDNVYFDDRPVHTIMSDKFFWEQDSSSYVFADRFGDTVFLVLIRVASGLFGPVYHQEPIETICPLGLHPCYENLSAVYFPKPERNAIQASFRGVLGTPSKKVMITLSPTTMDVLSILR